MLQVDFPSCFVGLVLENCELPLADYVQMVFADPSPILFYPISSTEIRCLVDVPGRKVPSIATGEMANFLKTIVAPQVCIYSNLDLIYTHTYIFLFWFYSYCMMLSTNVSFLFSRLLNRFCCCTCIKQDSKCGFITTQLQFGIFEIYFLCFYTFCCLLAMHSNCSTMDLITLWNPFFWLHISMSKLKEKEKESITCFDFLPTLIWFFGVTKF